MVRFAHSASAVQVFGGSDARHRHGTARQGTLRWCPTCHNQKDPQLKYSTIYWGWGEGLGRKSREKHQKRYLGFLIPSEALTSHQISLSFSYLIYKI